MASVIEYRRVRKVYNTGGDKVVALEEVPLDAGDGASSFEWWILSDRVFRGSKWR